MYTPREIGEFLERKATNETEALSVESPLALSLFRSMTWHHILQVVFCSYRPRISSNGVKLYLVSLGELVRWLHMDN